MISTDDVENPVHGFRPMSQNLDARIVAALSNDIGAAELASLIADVEDGLESAISIAADTVRRAMDPLDVLDANVARASVEDANFRVTRLEGALKCLTNRFYDLQTEET